MDEQNDYIAKRDTESAFSQAKEMVDVLMTPESELSQEKREWIAGNVEKNFANHVNKGFLQYRKSVTETNDFAITDWYGEGSILRDVMGREYIDMLGGFGLYSPGIRHPKIVAAVKAQLDRSPQYSQEMLDPLRAHLAKVIALLTPGDIQYGFFCQQRHGSRGWCHETCQALHWTKGVSSQPRKGSTANPLGPFPFWEKPFTASLFYPC